MDPAETFEHAGLTIRIYQDEDADSGLARDHDGILGCLIGHHPDYSFFDGPHDIEARGGLKLTKPCDVCEACPGWVKADDPNALEGCQPDEDGDVTCGKCGGDEEVQRSLADYFREEHGSRVVLPVFLLDHSGLALSWGHTNLLDEVVDELAATRSTNRFVGDEAGWDTSFIGFAFDSAESRERTGCDGKDWPDERIKESIESELDEYGKFIAGAVYGYVIVDEEDNQLASEWGFIGTEVVEQEAKWAAESCAEDVKHEREEAAYWRDREVLTIG